MVILGYLLSLIGLVCWVFILIDAFKNTVWKGVVGLLCGLYLLYYGIAEFQHPQKWPIVGGYIVGIFGGAAVQMMAMSAASHIR